MLTFQIPICLSLSCPTPDILSPTCPNMNSSHFSLYQFFFLGKNTIILKQESKCHPCDSPPHNQLSIPIWLYLIITYPLTSPYSWHYMGPLLIISWAISDRVTFLWREHPFVGSISFGKSERRSRAKYGNIHLFPPLNKLIIEKSSKMFGIC